MPEVNEIWGVIVAHQSKSMSKHFKGHIHTLSEARKRKDKRIKNTAGLETGQHIQG